MRLCTAFNDMWSWFTKRKGYSGIFKRIYEIFILNLFYSSLDHFRFKIGPLIIQLISKCNICIMNSRMSIKKIRKRKLKIFAAFQPYLTTTKNKRVHQRYLLYLDRVVWDETKDAYNATNILNVISLIQKCISSIYQVQSSIAFISRYWRQISYKSWFQIWIFF